MKESANLKDLVKCYGVLTDKWYICIVNKAYYGDMDEYESDIKTALQEGKYWIRDNREMVEKGEHFITEDSEICNNITPPLPDGADEKEVNLSLYSGVNFVIFDPDFDATEYWKHHTLNPSIVK